MDEAMRIYNPNKQAKVSYESAYNTQPKVSYEDVMNSIRTYGQVTSDSLIPKESKWKKICNYLCDGKTWKKVFEEHGKRERDLEQKYPWFEILHRWVIALCVFGLFISFIIWGISIYTERTAQAYADSIAAQKDAEHQAYIAQQEADRLAAEQSLENLMKSNAQVKAKLGYGSRNFIEKYNYGDADFMTLYQCVDNRLKNKMYLGMSIDEIVFKEGQFIASYDTNPVQDYYFNLAMKSERLKNDREAQSLPEPVGSDYVYAIYTQHGIYLANDPNAPAYTWWRYSE